MEYCIAELKTNKSLEKYPELMALSLNNLGCYNRRVQQNDSALNYFEQAFRILQENKT